ncbi:N-methyl-L-tryptophan oxidase [Natribacillus halophilus]|uniref:N-methyl-L-tryptophan oxidase n=1 Tax=Natribacillus halophilus TaxID=549003 RepID=A0A1G8LY84_9BACI|nr:N-methyl-L-tryptophan oxidase [Natribacillus halophilus]SDI60583.1 N-methyl-L-tryptophan oxidase [Natribacillus halophilus]
MSSDYDVVVVGAGSMGMAAGYYLSRQGAKTLLIDAFDPPHSQGSHHGETRIIRHAYGEGREYVPLAIRAQTLWNDLQEEADETIFEKTGVLGFGPEGSAFIDEAIASSREYSLSLDLLDADEINKRWPGIQLPKGYKGCFEPDSGVLYSENCIRAYRQLAEKHNATLLTNTPVLNIETYDNGVSVQTDHETFTAKKIVISAGPWSGKVLANLGLDIPLQPTRQTVTWFDSDPSLYESDAFPAFFVDVPSGVYYGFPSFDGCGVKLGRFDTGQKTEPAYVNREYGIFPEDEGDVREFLETYMPEAAGKSNRGRACIFTRTPDEHFVVDLHPQHSHIVIAAGFSGHGFKFASVIGEVLSQLALDGHTEHDISKFSITRSELHHPKVPQK